MQKVEDTANQHFLSVFVSGATQVERVRPQIRNSLGPFKQCILVDHNREPFQ
jgi:hypothetical protein